MYKIIVSMLICFMFLVACTPINNTVDTNPTDQSDGTTQTTPTAVPTATSTPEPQTALAIGQEATLGNWVLNLTSIRYEDEISLSYGSYTPDEGNIYIVADLDVKNTGKEADTFLPSFSLKNQDVTAKLLYADGYEFSSTIMIGTDDLHDKHLNPLASATGFIVFSVVEEVAQSEEPLQLSLALGKEQLLYELR